MRAAGNITVVLGVVVACGPWWMAALVVAAFSPYLAGYHSHPNRLLIAFLGDQEAGMAHWKGDALAASAAMLGILLLRFLQGMLPLAS